MSEPRNFRDVACDVMVADCPARTVLTLLAEKWVLLIIQALSEEPRRTGVLRRRIGGISEKMLIQTLKRLTRLGLVSRTDRQTVPPSVEYSLTERGWSLSPIVVQFDRWVESHAPAMIDPDRFTLEQEQPQPIQ